MRTNVELKKEWTKLTKYCDEYEIEIFMQYCDNELTLNVIIDIDGEMADYECIMCIEDATEPTREMKRKFANAARYFGKHFDNVDVINDVIVV